jgi:Leucine-rich repeat (LRR) protein
MAVKDPPMSRPFWSFSWPVRLPTDHDVFQRSQYRRQKYLCIGSLPVELFTQKKEKQRILQEWIEFFQSPSPVRELALRRRVPQELFDAVCRQRELQRLHIKHGPVTDLSPLRNLKKLEGLSLGTTSVEDISPLASLPRLTHLELNNLKHVYDHHALADCSKLEYLHVEGYWQGPQKIKMKNIEFLEKLKNLRALSIDFVIIEDFDVEYLLGLKKLEYLLLPDYGRVDNKRLKEHAARLCDALPKLRYGNVVEHCAGK